MFFIFFHLIIIINRSSKNKTIFLCLPSQCPPTTFSCHSTELYPKKTPKKLKKKIHYFNKTRTWQSCRCGIQTVSLSLSLSSRRQASTLLNLNFVFKIFSVIIIINIITVISQLSMLFSYTSFALVCAILKEPFVDFFYSWTFRGENVFTHFPPYERTVYFNYKSSSLMVNAVWLLPILLLQQAILFFSYEECLPSLIKISFFQNSACLSSSACLCVCRVHNKMKKFYVIFPSWCRTH